MPNAEKLEQEDTIVFLPCYESLRVPYCAGMRTEYWIFLYGWQILLIELTSVLGSYIKLYQQLS